MIFLWVDTPQNMIPYDIMEWKNGLLRNGSFLISQKTTVVSGIWLQKMFCLVLVSF